MPNVVVKSHLHPCWELVTCWTQGTKSTLFCSSPAVVYWALAGNMKKNCAHLGTQLSSVHGKGKPVFDICFSSFLEIHYLTCFLKAFKSLARFQLPGGRGGGSGSDSIVPKKAVFRKKCPREVCIPALRAIPHPRNGTHVQCYIYGNKSK